MSEHPNVQRMREGYAAFAKGDFAALEDLMTEDVRWHVAGRTAISGTYEGRAAVFDFFRKVMELTEGSFRVEPLTLLADDRFGCAPVRITADRGDRHLDVMNVQTARMEDGRVVEFWDTTTDTEAGEAFYA